MDNNKKEKDLTLPLFNTFEGHGKSLVALLDNAAELTVKCLEIQSREYNITLPQLKVLSLLSAVSENGATLQELAKWTFREINSVSILIRRMEKDGLVKKIVTPHKVSNRYFLTDAGHELAATIASGTRVEMIFDCLTEEEQAHLREYLIKIEQRGEKLLGLDYVPPFLK